MKLLKKVSVRDIKRTFVMSDLCKAEALPSGRYESEEHFLAHAKAVEEKVLSMTDAELDKYVGVYQLRLLAYDSSEWFVAEVSPHEIGVWDRAAGLSQRWTSCSVATTAKKVARALNRKNGFKKQATTRAAQAIPEILRVSVGKIQSNPLLFPITFKCDTGTMGRKSLRIKTELDIDDGCMRSVALAVSGAQKIKVYFGRPV